MTYKEQLDAVLDDVDTMGFDSAFKYSYHEIDNKTFHKLREAYLTAKDRLENYMKKHASKEKK